MKNSINYQVYKICCVGKKRIRCWVNCTKQTFNKYSDGMKRIISDEDMKTFNF